MKHEIFVPGRIELAGNHTDHQRGRVLAGATELGLYSKFEANGTNCIRINSEGFGKIELRIGFSSVRPKEFGDPTASVRGVLAGFEELGLKVGGFDASIRSTLPPGSGMGSSAAFAVMIGKILSELFNGGQVDALVIARIAQQAEIRYFGKPCGLMDHLTCSLGHTLYADFTTNEILPVTADFTSMGLVMCLTDTGGSHAGLDTSYARIPADMVYIANLFDKGVLGDVSAAEFRAKGWDASDRPVRRAMHFFDENERVPMMRDALEMRDGEQYMRLMNESGRSSEKLLNNIVTSATGDTKLAQGLEKSKKLLDGRGAWRVHGGGFAGCVQALMPEEYFPVYKESMEKDFGEGSCRQVTLIL